MTSNIDPNLIIENGDSPTAIILAIAILPLLLFNGLSGLLNIVLTKKK